MGIFGDIIEVLGESLEAYNADMAEMAKAKETYNRLAKKYGKPVITGAPAASSTTTSHKVPELMSFESYMEAHRFLQAARYTYQSPDIWKKGGIIARGRRVSTSSYVVTFHEL